MGSMDRDRRRRDYYCRQYPSDSEMGRDGICMGGLDMLYFHVCHLVYAGTKAFSNPLQALADSGMDERCDCILLNHGMVQEIDGRAFNIKPVYQYSVGYGVWVLNLSCRERNNFAVD